MNTLIQWDTDLFLYLNGMGTPFWDPFWEAIAGTAIWIPFYAFLLFILFRTLSLKSFGIAVLCIALNVVFTDQGSVQLFKEQVQRLRPCHNEAIQEQVREVEGCGGKYGFVSSHASNVFGLAMLLSLLYRGKNRKTLVWGLFIWASVVGYSRIYLGKHYPLDVIAGAGLGVLCGLLSYQIFRWIGGRHE